MTRTRRGPAFFGRYAQSLARSFGMRLPALLLLLVQVIAPMWHVCEMGGRCGDCKPQANGVLMCHGGARANASRAGDRGAPEASPPRCEHCKPRPGLNGAFADSDSRPGDFEGTCLARELRGMPFAAMTPLSLAVTTRRVRLPRPGAVAFPALACAPLPPTRGPPVLPM